MGTGDDGGDTGQSVRLEQYTTCCCPVLRNLSERRSHLLVLLLLVCTVL